MTDAAKKYPLLFPFAEKVSGRGFATNVKMDGRILAERDEDGWWFYGVNPGAIAESGETIHEAFANFQRRLKAVLFDFASEAADFDSFKEEVERFFNQTDADADDWSSARDAVRSGQLSLEGLRRDATERRPTVEVERLQTFTPAQNVLDEDAQLAA